LVQLRKFRQLRPCFMVMFFSIIFFGLYSVTFGRVPKLFGFEAWYFFHRHSGSSSGSSKENSIRSPSGSSSGASTVSKTVNFFLRQPASR
jgi:hypothetical protein